MRASAQVSQHDPLMVVMIVGAVRSGSTLLGQLLGEPDDYVHIGELNYIWKRGFLKNRLCGCGKPFRECQFWNDVFDLGFGGLDKVDATRFIEIKNRIERTRNLPRLFSKVMGPNLSSGLEEYKSTLRTLYRSIAEVAGARVVVDSSKAPPYAYVLERVPGIDLRTIHLVRDSRAVAFSIQRKKVDPSETHQVRYLQTLDPVSMSFIWSITNGLLSARPAGVRSMLLRYEDLVANPEPILQRIGTLMDDTEFARNCAKALVSVSSINHTVSGNPNRFDRGITIKPDLEWESKLPRPIRMLVTTLTIGYLIKYGYLGHAAPGKSVSTPFAIDHDQSAMATVVGPRRPSENPK